MALPLVAALPMVGELVGGLLDALSGDKKAQAEQALALIRAVQAESEGQQRINEAEARHPSIFVAGWRPAVGWVCAAGLAYQYFARPLMEWAVGVWSPGAPLPPSLDGGLMELVLALLGIGGLRTIEKCRGVRR